MQEANVSIEDLKLDYDIYPRTQISDTHVAAMQDAVDAGADLPPILVCAKSMRIVDGFHRYTRAHKAGDAVIPCILEDFKDKAALFEAAVHANAAHGKPYSPYERAHIVKQAEEFGFSVKRISGALLVSVDKVADIQAGFVGVGTTQQPVKATIRHLRGGKISKEQAQAAKKLGGMPQRFYIEQLLILVENNLINVEDDAVMIKLVKLVEGIVRLLDSNPIKVKKKIKA